MRLIDADQFLADESEAFMAAQLKVKDEATRLVNEVVHKKVTMLIADTPTIDAAPVVHGEWIWTERGDDDYEQYWVCSKCGQQQYVETNYCPDCGAKMDGGNKDAEE